MFEYDPKRENQMQENEKEHGAESQWNNSEAWNGTVPPLAPQRPHRSSGGLKTVGICLLVAAVAFVGGYAGTKLAWQGLDRVIIKEVGEGSGGDKSEENSSGNGDVQVLGAQGVAEKAVPSVVAIRTEQMTTGDFWFGSQVTSGAGSGVIISEDGYIVTNAHVVDGADTITVELSNGKSYKAKLVGSYTNGDIAVVKIEAENLPAAAFASMDSVHQGEPVYAIGNPEGNFSGSFTGGYLSALDRQIQVSVEGSSGNGYFGGSSSRVITLDVLQFDAAVSPGNSGGGLFDADGNLIGIVCAKSAASNSEGLGFAIPCGKAQEIAMALISNGVYRPEGDGSSEGNTNTNKAILGISAAYLDAATAQQYGYRSAGVYVVEITVESTYRAGLRVGDRLISIDGTVIEDLDTVTEYLADKVPGEAVDLLVERSNRTNVIRITLVENSAAKQ